MLQDQVGLRVRLGVGFVRAMGARVYPTGVLSAQVATGKVAMANFAFKNGRTGKQRAVARLGGCSTGTLVLRRGVR